MQQPEFLTVFIQPLEEMGVPYFVTGSIAAVIYGEPRLTHDIDIVIHLDTKEVNRFMGMFPESAYYCPPFEVIQIEMKRSHFGHFNLIHHASGLKADIYPNSGDELHAWALKNRKRVAVGTHQSIWVAAPEYLILRKLEYYREGRSQKHLEDIRKMLPQIRSSLDMAFLTPMLTQLGLVEYWNQVS